MEANQIEIKEKVPASRKLQADDAAELLQNAANMTVAKGKKVQEFAGGKGGGKAGGEEKEAAITAMLGSTGNLRAPTLVVGKTLLVGFNEAAYAEAFGV